MPRNILIIDDTPFWRDVTTEALRQKGFTTFTASDGVEALKVLRDHPADLIILDIEMPGMQGLDFLQKIRSTETLKTTPVIMLTGDMQRAHVIQATQLGAADYLLKARFSMADLLSRIDRRLPAAGINPRPPTVSTSPMKEPDIKPLLTRQQSIARATQAMSGRNISVAAAEVISLANSPRSDLSDLADVIGRDPILSAKVFQASNQASNSGRRVVVTTLPEAVRILGCMRVRDIAVAVGIFEAMPAPIDRHFDPIRSWQHSLAVARICSMLAPPETSGTAYLAGLCHDLGEFLFRTHFGQEHDEVLRAQAATGKPQYELERLMLGITHGELAQTILHCLELPEAISRPIAEHHEWTRSGTPSDAPIARILQLADQYATGLLLTHSKYSTVRPFSHVECRRAVGADNPEPPDARLFCSEIQAMTALHTASMRKSPGDPSGPIFERQPGRLLLVRDPAISSFDPVGAALESLADVTVINQLPKQAELAECDGLVILTRNNALNGFTSEEIATVTNRDNVHIPTLWLVAHLAEGRPLDARAPKPCLWPIQLDFLARFVISLANNESKAVPPSSAA